MTEREVHASLRRRAAAAAAVVVLLGAITYLAWPWIGRLSDPDQAQQLIKGAGAWAPLLFIAVQMLQVILAPLPGQAIVLAGGYLFGPVLGLVYTIIGSTLASAIIFVLTRRLGRPFVEHFVSATTLARFDRLAESKGALVFFFIFLLPALPDDIVAFVAGLTGIPIGTLVMVSVAGRLPGYAVLSMAGYGLTQENLVPVIVLLVAMALLLAVAFWKRAWLREVAESDDRAALVAEAWRVSWRTVIVVIIVAATASVVLARIIM